MIEWAGRYADEAARQARVEQDPRRRAELERIAEVCRRVPARPARTLHEALQAVLFVHYAAQMESYEAAISPGRIDQFLYPYYAADVAAGRLTRETARELLECFYLKLSESLPLFDSDTSVAFSGLTAWANTVIGGMDADGRDATNDLSYLALEAMEQMRTPQPNFGVRLHAHTPPAFRRRVCQAIAGGIGNLQVFDDEVVIAALVERGIPLAAACNYGVIGCVEPAVPGCSFTSSDAALFNLGLCLELALNQRINPKGLVGEKGAETLDRLLGGYLALGGMHLQWEIVDRATLLAAQERPDESAYFYEAFLGRGLVVNLGGMYLLPRLVGLHKAKELAFFGERVYGPQAVELGLANRAVPDVGSSHLERRTPWARRSDENVNGRRVVNRFLKPPKRSSGRRAS